MDYKKKTNYSIQGLRGCAALCVLFYHVFFRFEEMFICADGPRVLHRLGFFGVCIFLIISGLFCNWSDMGAKAAIRFFRKRVWRIWRVYAIAITVESIIIFFSGYPQSINHIIYMENITFINGFINTPYIDGAHWYISVILAFYIIISILISFESVERWYVYIIWMGVNGIGSVLDIPYLSNFLGGKYIGAFTLGVATKIILTNEFGQIKKQVGWLIVMASSFGYSIVSMGTISTLYLIIAYVIVVIAYLDKCVILRFEPLIFIGDSSFHIYLIHQMIAYPIEYYILSSVGSVNILSKVLALTIAIIGGIIFYTLDKKISSCRFINKDK